MSIWKLFQKAEWSFTLKGCGPAKIEVKEHDMQGVAAYTIHVGEPNGSQP